MPDPTLILNAAAIQRALTRIAHEIAERNETGNEVVLVGIQRGGVPLGKRLGELLAGIWGQAVPTGSLDVSMHRDDLSRRAAPNVQPTVIPFDVTGKTVVFVDDVLFSGRTIRAAMHVVADTLTAHGFAAHAEDRGETTAVVAEQCPFGNASTTNPVLCAVDRGMVTGLLAGLCGRASERALPVILSSRARGDAACTASA